MRKRLIALAILAHQLRKRWIALAILAAGLCAALPAHAGRPHCRAPRVRTRAVAFFPLVFYRWDGPVLLREQGPTLPREQATKAPAEPKSPESPASGLFAQCVRCHSGAAPSGGLDLAKDLDQTARLKAIARLLEDDPERRMPPPGAGIEIDAEERGLLIQFFAKETTP